MTFRNIARKALGPTYPRFPHRTDRSLSTVPFRDPQSQFPPVLETKLWYVDRGILSGTAVGAFAQWPFRANGPRDPYVPIGGHSARGWNTFGLFYSLYACYHSEIVVEFRNNLLYPDQEAEVDAMDVVVGITLLNNNMLFYNNVTSCMEDPFSRTAVLHRPGEIAQLRMNWDFKAFWPADTYSDIVDVPGFISTTPTDPAYNYQFIVWSHPYYGQASYDLSATVMMSFDTLFWQPRTQFVIDMPETEMSEVFVANDNAMFGDSTGEATFDRTEKVEVSTHYTDVTPP